MSEKPKIIEIIVSPQGVARHIHSDVATSITAAIGPQEIRRASHVEPTSELPDAAVFWLFKHGPYINHPLPDDLVHKLLTAGVTSWGPRKPDSAQIEADLLRKYMTTTLKLYATWWASMLPVQGPVLGPFDTHATAIEAELTWLKDHHLPVCPTGKC